MPIFPADGRTADPTTTITRVRRAGQATQRVEYVNQDGDRWYIDGLCNACGACEVNRDGRLSRSGVVRVEGKSIGEPGAVYEEGFATRLDMPLRPDLTWDTPSCVLSGEYTVRTASTPPDRRTG